MCKSFLIICWLFLCSSLFAQNDEISFRHYGVSDGLSDNQIRCLYFDSQGFLWIGTNEGLNRFDGEEFIHYKKDNGKKFSLCGNVVTDVLEDLNADLWIATRDGGICHLNRNTGEVFTPVLYNDSLQNIVSYVHRLRYGADGLLYVATDKGLFVSNADYTAFRFTARNRRGAYYDVLPTGRGMIVAQINKSIAILSSDTITSLTKSQTLGNTGHTFNAFFKDHKNQIWAGAWDHYLHSYSDKENKLTSYDFKNSGTTEYINEEIYCITEAAPDLLWLGMKSGSIWTFDTKTHSGAPLQVSAQESGRLNGSRIFSMMTDPQGRTWVGTDAGLHVFNPYNSKFKVHWIGSPKAAVNDFLRTGDSLWVATLEGLFISTADKMMKAPPFETGEEEAHTIYRKDNGELWAGTGSSAQILNTKKNRFEIPPYSTSEDIGSKWGATKIHDIGFFQIDGSEKLLYTAYGHGTIVYNPGNGDWVLGNVYMGEAIDNLVRGMLVDSHGRLWFFGALQGIGLFEKVLEDKWSPNSKSRIKTATLQCTPYFQNNISRVISAMVEDEHGHFWVGTQGSGILYFEPEKDSLWFSPVIDSPLSVRSLVRDKAGLLWMNASGGLYSYNPALAEWKRYDEKDGIPSAGLSQGLMADADGKLFIGGNGFYMSFDPSMIAENREKPRTLITHFEVMNQPADSLLLHSGVMLPFAQNFLTFHFTSRCFNNAANCQFRYKLEGLDEEWRNNGTLNFVHYNKLPFGQYTFRVKAINSSGVPDENESTLSFTIRAPFYLRWWFIAIAALVAAFVVMALLRYRHLQKRKLETIRNKIARDLHDDVGSALGSISYFSASALKGIEENQMATSKMVLEKIGHTSREMIENMHDIVWAVNPKNDSLEHLIERMHVHAADLAAGNNLRLVFSADENLRDIKLSMEVRKNIFLIFKEALYNSVKYSDCHALEVKIKAYGSGFEMQVADNGRGFNVEERKGKGNGLTNMMSRAREIGARLEINSSAGGTIVKLIF